MKRVLFLDSTFINERITELRLKKGISEYKMSLDLGHSKGYIQSISSGRALPSLTEFLYICEYFDITPAEFFSAGKQDTILIEELEAVCSCLSPDDLHLLIRIAKRMKSGGRREGAL